MQLKKIRNSALSIPFSGLQHKQRLKLVILKEAVTNCYHKEVQKVADISDAPAYGWLFSSQEMSSQLRADNFSPSSTYLPGPLHEPPNATGVALHFTIRAPLLVQKEAESPQILGELGSSILLLIPF